jgi:hypothetical protein
LKAKDNTLRGEGVEWFTGAVSVCLLAAKDEAPEYLQFSSIAAVNSMLEQRAVRIVWLEQFHTVPPR